MLGVFEFLSTTELILVVAVIVGVFFLLRRVLRHR